MKRWFKYIALGVLTIFLIGLLIPQNLQMPVVGAGSGDYNHKTFWYPWGGRARVHKGVDIFAKRGTNIFWDDKETHFVMVNKADEIIDFLNRNIR